MATPRAMPPIETCTACRGTAAEQNVLWDCLPVPCFGNPERSRVRVATVSLNPSSFEFVDGAGKPRPKEDRLPMVGDFGTNRAGLPPAALREARRIRDSYFANKPHGWFTPMQMVLREMNPGWSYAEGTAVQIDVVACATNPSYGKITSAAVRRTLEENCRPFLAHSVGHLTNGTWLIINGSGAFEALRQAVTVLPNADYEISLKGNPALRIFVGQVQANGKALPYFGWSLYLHREPMRRAGAIVDYWKSLPARI